MHDPHAISGEINSSGVRSHLSSLLQDDGLEIGILEHMGLRETGEVAEEEVELLWLTYMNPILRQG